MASRISAQKGYRASFSHAFGTPTATGPRVATALAAFERTLLSGDSDFDRYYYGKQSTALPLNAIRGLALFRGVAGCDGCHTIGDRSALFTDQRFHTANIGIGRIAERLPELTVSLVTRRHSGVPLDQIVLEDSDFSELGRFVVTLDPKDVGRFKTPTLRDVARTAPYMHDGSVPTLELAVDRELYARETGRRIDLTPAERADLVDFLKALTGRSNARGIANDGAARGINSNAH